MKHIKHVLSALVMSSSLLAPALYADSNSLKQQLLKNLPDISIDDIQPSKIKGLYEVLSGTNVFYTSEDGQYLIQGKLYDLATKQDLTEKRLATVKAALINTVPQSELIVFKAPMEKYKINIFTDIDCGYCRKLHSEIDSYLAEGITIQYLFYPRAGKDSESYKKAVSVWCAEDKNSALTLAKSRSENVETKNCDNPVTKHMELGESLGVRGTPMMITAKGTVFPGYMPAKKLAEALRSD